MKYFHELKEIHIDLTDAIVGHSADESITYKEVDGTPIYLGYYFPKDYDRTRKYPTFIFIHGGGWSGHKIFADQPHWQGDYLGFLARYYADKGFVSVSMDYRLSSQDRQTEHYQIIDCYEDCCDAMDYVLAHAEEYGVDVDAMYLLGESAGGHLAGAVATFHYDRKYTFQKVFLVNAITDLYHSTWNESVPRMSTHRALKDLNMEERAKFLSPLYQVDENMPEVVMIHGEADTCVLPEHSEKFYQKMQEFSGRCDLHIIEKTNHAFLLAEYVKESRCACNIGIEIIDQYMFEQQFIKAVPVWKKGDCWKMNQTLGFYTNIPKKSGSKLYITGLSSYTVFVNGTFVSFGPARAAKGFYKVDEIELDPYLTAENNRVFIKTCSYAINSFCYLDGEGFLCAEIRNGESVLAATGFDFKAKELTSRIRKVPRYSFQRTFCEVYSLNEELANEELMGLGEEAELEIAESKKFFKRDVPFSEYKRILPSKVFRKGSIGYSEKEKYYCPREMKNISDFYKGFKVEEFEFAPHMEYQRMDFSGECECDLEADNILLNKDSFVDLEMEGSMTGLFSAEIEFLDEGTLFIAFSEVFAECERDWRYDYCNLSLKEGEVDWAKEVLNVIPIRAQKGTYRFVSSEPYVMKYVRLAAQGADIRIKNFSLIEIAFPESRITLKCTETDEEMKKIYDAALLSFRANVLDIYMDCPSRERAGWLCDSFFMGRSESIFTGESVVEKAFLKNFLLPDEFEGIPEGMLPPCYPADVLNKGEFISTWAMWFGLQVYDYYCRTEDWEFISFAKDRLYKLLGYFKAFENEYGLLENLPGIFIEWSFANHLTEEISFPANMVYAAFKSALGVLYDDKTLVEEGRSLRKTIGALSFTESGFFCDNAVRKDGKLVLSGERTEVCQYYAFFFHVATPETHADLWNTLMKDFGTDREKKGIYSEIYPANSFVGNYLRLDLMLRYDLKDTLRLSIKEYFLYMAEKTGTLWEHSTPRASCNHGFASYVAYWIAMLEKENKIGK